MVEACPECSCTMRCDQVGSMLICECYYCGYSDAIDILSTPSFTEVEMYGMTLREGVKEWTE